MAITESVHLIVRSAPACRQPGYAGLRRAEAWSAHIPTQDMPAQAGEAWVWRLPDRHYHGDVILTLVSNIVTFRQSRSSRGVTGDSRLMERVRCPRAGFVTPHPGGPGHRSAGTRTGLRGAR
jgi:hypothetical protein